MKRIFTLLYLFSFIHLSKETAPACPATGGVNWSSGSTWSTDTHGLGRTGKPEANDNVTIPSGEVMILDEENVPTLGNLVIDGTLQLDEGNGMGNKNEFTISVKKITISSTGRLIVGCEDDPFEGVAIFSLIGEKSSTPNDKVIVVEGGLDLHGINYDVQWTTLASATTSPKTISLTDTVTWPQDDEIVIAPTGFKPDETEVLSIDRYTGGDMRLNSKPSNDHLGESTTLTSSKVIRQAAEVGHLSRNIKIVGEDYAQMSSDNFGARVHVASSGWARITNTEFYHTGMLQYPIDYSDPRFSIVFSGISYSTSQPCYVKKSAFHDGFSPAIGIFDTPQMEISDNVIHHTVGSAIITNSSSTNLNHNLIVLVYWPGAFGRNPADNSNNDYHGAIESQGAISLVLTNNSIAGIERACYHGEPELCTNAACSTSTWSGNICHTSFIGLGLYPHDVVGSGFPGTHGWQFSGFTIYKCWDFGIYYNHQHSIKIRNNILMDNGVSIFTMIYEPHLTNHDMATSKSVMIDSCLLVGISPLFNCSSHTQSNSDNNYKKSSNARSWRRDATSSNSLKNSPALTGIAWPSFTSGANNATWETFIEPTQYNAMLGKMEIKNTEFAYFRQSCSKETTAFSTNPKNYDFQHPVTIETATKSDSVDDDNLVYFHFPDTNDDDQKCNGILCDGLRKAILQDKDGSFLGSIGAAIPKAENDWDSQKYDKKVAKVNHPAGFTYKISELAQYKGVFRDGCTDKTPNSKWQGYFCGGNGWQYRILVIESLDNDTETRTGAPLTLLGWTDSGAGVVDLISGPNYKEVTDWTSDPITEKTNKIATYHAVVALDRNYSLYFNGIPPQHIRYHLLNADTNDGIRIGTYYSMPNHLDVYFNDAYQDPKNDANSAYNVLDLEFTSPLSQYLPIVTADIAGANFLDREWNLTQIVIKGSGIIEVALTPAIIMAFNVNTARATDGNFENDLTTQIQTTAQSVVPGIVTNNIRTAYIKSNTDNTTTWWMEISDEICQTLSTCSGAVTQYTKEQYDALAVALFDTYQLDLYSSSLQLIEGVWAAEALPRVISDVANDWSTATGSSYTYFKMLRIPRNLVIYQAPVATYEGVAFTTQPKLHFVNADGEHVDVLGASPQSWYCLATYQSGSGTYNFQALNGTTNISFYNGWANFSDLSFFRFGSNYIIDFNIVVPTSASFQVSSSPINVLPRPLEVKVASVTTVLQNQSLNIEVEIWDTSLGAKVTDLNWNNNQFFLNVTLSSHSVGVYDGSWSGTTFARFVDSTGIATLSNFVLDSVGLIFFDINVYSDLTNYDLTSLMTIYVYPSRHAYLTFPISATMTMKFEISYATYGNLQFAALIYTYLSQKFPNSQISNIVISEGSVLLTFTIAGTSDVVTGVIEGICDNIIEGKNFVYNGTTIPIAKSLSKNNETYYGVHCGPPDYSSVKIALIVGIVVGIIAIIVIIFFIFWKLKRRPREKTLQSEDGSTTIKSEFGRAYMVERKIGRQNTFNSLSSLISDSPSPVSVPVKVNPRAKRLAVVKQGSNKIGATKGEKKELNTIFTKGKGRTTRTRHF